MRLVFRVLGSFASTYGAVLLMVSIWAGVRRMEVLGKPVRPQACLLRLPGSMDSRTCLLMISMSTITRAMPSDIW